MLNFVTAYRFETHGLDRSTNEIAINRIEIDFGTRRVPLRTEGHDDEARFISIRVHTSTKEPADRAHLLGSKPIFIRNAPISKSLVKLSDHAKTKVMDRIETALAMTPTRVVVHRNNVWLDRVKVFHEVVYHPND
jgi:hypothetical protein